MQRRWTAEEDAYLSEKWGTASIAAICKHLGRTEGAIVNRKTRLGLGAFCEAGDYVTFNQLTLAFCGSNAGNAYKLKSWVENRGFPMRTKAIRKSRVKVVYLDEFWKWAEKNRSFLDFSKLEPLSLGKEPVWVKEQRRKDYYANALQRKDPWSAEEDSMLAMLVKQHRYSYSQISEMLHRSEGAIQHRCSDLGLKERPVRVGPHESAWTEELYQRLADGIRNGDSYMQIARAVGKSEKAVRGKVYTTYYTESADKVRKMMGAGPWGSGAPEPRIKQAMYLNGYKQQAKDALSELVGVLTYRMQSMDDSPYWQRRMCLHWDDVRCKMGCNNCDECNQFQRISPQYCARCGATFFERKQNRFCQACRTARKKQAQRRWRRQQKGGL